MHPQRSIPIRSRGVRRLRFMTTAPFARLVGASRPQAPSTTPPERSAGGSARRADGEETERSGVPQPLAPLRGAGGVVGLAAGREASGEWCGASSSAEEEPLGRHPRSAAT
jgi:hypothetical protein